MMTLPDEMGNYKRVVEIKQNNSPEDFSCFYFRQPLNENFNDFENGSLCFSGHLSRISKTATISVFVFFSEFSPIFPA